MVIKNMVTKNTITFTPINWRTPNWNVTIDGTSVNYLKNATVNLGLNTNVDTARLTLDNTEGRYTKEFDKGDIVKIYADFDSGTNQIFEGKIMTPTYRMIPEGKGAIFDFDIFCRGYGGDAIGRKVNYHPTESKMIYNIIKNDLLGSYLPNHSTDYSGIENITTKWQPDWNFMPLTQCLNAINIDKLENNYDFRCDFSKKWSFFTRGSKINGNEVLVYADNMIGLDATNGDLLQLKNRLFGSGDEVEGIPLIRMRENLASQELYGIVEDTVNNTNWATRDQISEGTAGILTKLTTLEQYGSGYGIGMPTLVPGEMLYIINPFCDVQGLRRIVSVEHTLQDGVFLTGIVFQELEKGLTKIMEDRIINEQLTSSVANKHTMEDSWVFRFEGDDDSNLLTQTRTLVWDGNLMLDLKEVNGWARTIAHQTEKDVTGFSLYISGDNLDPTAGESAFVTYDVSFDEGNSWEKGVSLDTEYSVPSGKTGKLAMIQINFNSLTTKIKAVGLHYKYS